MRHGMKTVGAAALLIAGCASPMNSGITAMQTGVDKIAAQYGQENTVMTFRESLLDAEAKKTGRVVLQRGAKIGPYYYEDFNKQRLTNGVVRKRVAVEEDVLVEADVVAPQNAERPTASSVTNVYMPPVQIPEATIESTPNQGVFGEIIRGGK